MAVVPTTSIGAPTTSYMDQNRLATTAMVANAPDVFINQPPFTQNFFQPLPTAPIFMPQPHPAAISQFYQVPAMPFNRYPIYAEPIAAFPPYTLPLHFYQQKMDYVRPFIPQNPNMYQNNHFKPMMDPYARQFAMHTGRRQTKPQQQQQQQPQFKAETSDEQESTIVAQYLIDANEAARVTSEGALEQPQKPQHLPAKEMNPQLQKQQQQQHRTNLPAPEQSKQAENTKALPAGYRVHQRPLYIQQQPPNQRSARQQQFKSQPPHGSMAHQQRRRNTSGAPAASHKLIMNDPNARAIKVKQYPDPRQLKEMAAKREFKHMEMLKKLQQNVAEMQLEIRALKKTIQSNNNHPKPSNLEKVADKTTEIRQEVHSKEVQVNEISAPNPPPKVHRYPPTQGFRPQPPQPKCNIKCQQDQPTEQCIPSITQQIPNSGHGYYVQDPLHTAYYSQEPILHPLAQRHIEYLMTGNQENVMTCPGQMAQFAGVELDSEEDQSLRMEIERIAEANTEQIDPHKSGPGDVHHETAAAL